MHSSPIHPSPCKIPLGNKIITMQNPSWQQDHPDLQHLFRQLSIIEYLRPSSPNHLDNIALVSHGTNMKATKVGRALSPSSMRLAAKLRVGYVSLSIVRDPCIFISISISTTYKGTNMLGYNQSHPSNTIHQTDHMAPMLSSTQHFFISISTISISTTYKGTNMLGYNQSHPSNTIHQTDHMAPMLSSTQHFFKSRNCLLTINAH
jgi:hypothetical protein